MNDITCLMLYYGRQELAEESMESFLRQTYPHKKLVIINDHPDPVWFEKKYSNVEVHNLKPDTFSNLNEKYNYAFSFVGDSWWCPWETDDIWLPNHLANLAKNIPEGKTKYPKKVGIPKSYLSIDNKIVKLSWQMWTGSIYEKTCKCDSTIARNCDSQMLFKNWSRTWLWPSQGWPVTLIFRWAKEGHASRKGEKDILKYQSNLKKRIHSMRRKEPWRPHWRRDYVRDVEEFVWQSKEGINEPVHNI